MTDFYVEQKAVKEIVHDDWHWGYYKVDLLHQTYPSVLK